MSKRKKKSPLRNEFTDALDVEITERKIIERTQPEKVITESTPVEETPIPQIVEVVVDKKLEERILKEADNDFFDEKPSEVSTEKPLRKSIYHSKALQKWEDEQDEKKSAPKISEQKIEQPHKMSHAEKAGVVISVVMLIYSFANFDKPLFFLALSLFVHFLGSPVSSRFGKHSNSVQNTLRTFSIVLFCGAVLFLFI